MPASLPLIIAALAGIQVVLVITLADAVTAGAGRRGDGATRPHRTGPRGAPGAMRR